MTVPTRSVPHGGAPVKCVHQEAREVRLAEVRELERRADSHFDRCPDCRGRRPCAVWSAYWRRVVELEAGL